MLSDLYKDLLQFIYLNTVLEYKDIKAGIKTCRHLKKVLSNDNFIRNKFNIGHHIEDAKKYLLRCHVRMHFQSSTYRHRFIGTHKKNNENGLQIYCEYDIKWGHYPIDDMKKSFEVKLSRIPEPNNRRSYLINISLETRSNYEKYNAQPINLMQIRLKKGVVAFSYNYAIEQVLSNKRPQEILIKLVRVDNTVTYYIDGKYVGTYQLYLEGVMYPLIRSNVHMSAEFLD